MLKQEPIYCPRCGKLLAVKLPNNIILIRYNDSRATLLTSVIEGKLMFVCASKRYRDAEACGERIDLHFQNNKMEIIDQPEPIPCGTES